jgi:hypothetical protein
MVQIRRKLYRRGSSFETTVPMPLLFAIDARKRYSVIFNYDAEKKKWYLEIEERKKK